MNLINEHDFPAAILSVNNHYLSLLGTGLLATTTGESRTMKDDAGEKSFPDTNVHMLGTERDTAFFWSGKTQGIGSPERAAEIAKMANGKTLETVLAERGITPPVYDGSKEVNEWWGKASADYAAGVSGTVRVVLGQKVRDESIWNTKELPSLMENARVTRIIAIDPATLKETMLFDRSAESTRDQPAPRQDAIERDPHRRAALAFSNEPQENAVKQHPMLAGAYAAMTAIEKQAQASGLNGDQQSRIVATARENIAKSIQQGQYPEVKIRERNEAIKEHSYER